jgi:endonuclease YncB( thermonuclease family)
MTVRKRLLSAGRQGAKALLAGLIFVAGLLAGAMLEPVTASRGAGPRSADDPMEQRTFEAAPARLAHAAEVLRVIDGDTFEARVRLWPGLDVTTRVRLRGIDAPELKARCDDERAHAEAAREALRTILDQGEVRIAQVMPDKYGGRVLADAFTRSTPDVSAALLQSGVARRYDGGRRNDWCR